MKRRYWTRLFRATDGISTIEFAFVAPIIALLIIGMLDFGRALWEQMEVGNAARAGAAFVSINGWNATQTQIENAVTSATSLAVSASPVPSSPAWCGCPNTTSGITSTTCGSTCVDGTLAGHYITVSAKVAYSPILSWSSAPTTLTASATARLYP